MMIAGIFYNIMTNYLPYIVCAVLAIVFIWTLSETPVKDSVKNNITCSDQVKNDAYFY